MWTHRHPYKPSELTRESIEQRGRLALSRSLNIGRVIGFVGSGATKAYGRPSWNDLVGTAITCVERATLNDPFERRSAQRLLTELQAIRESDGANSPERLILALGTAEELAEKLGVLDEVREAIARDVARSRTAARELRTDGLMQIQGRTVLALGLDHPGIKCRAEPLEAAIQKLRINRFLTLNYDLEIEREFRRWFRTSGATSHHERATSDRRSDFERLCDIHDCEESERATWPQSVEYVDGLRRSVKSVSMTDTNIGELVNFALHPRSYEAQVFHLHGRCDKLKDMVLTERDYQSTYLKPGVQQYTFDEALSTIFSGNEVLFIGVGMDETDMMRPLRQFVSQDRKPDLAKQPVYALMEQQCTFSLSDTIVDEADFEDQVRRRPRQTVAPSDGQTGACGSTKSTAMTDLISENARALQLKSQYGVHVIYYGNQGLRDLWLLTSLIASLMKGGEDAIVEDVGSLRPSEAWRAAWSCLAGKILDVDLAQPMDTRPDWTRHFQDDEVLRFKAWIATFDSQIVNLCSIANFGATATDEGKEAREAIEAFAWNLQGEIRSRALQLALEDLAEARDRWWEDWRRTPLPRRSKYSEKDRKSGEDEFIAVYGNGTFQPSEDDVGHEVPPQVRITSRHRPHYRPLTIEITKGESSFAAIDQLVELGKSQNKAEEAWRKFTRTNDGKDRPPSPYSNGEVDGVRILRCAIPRGGGKGALLHILQQFTFAKKKTFSSADQPILHQIFQHDKEHGYHRAFCVHISFSMEFASVIEALRRFFKDALLELMRRRAQEIVALDVVDPDRMPDFYFFKSWAKALQPESALSTKLRDKLQIKPDDDLLARLKDDSDALATAFRLFVDDLRPRERQPNRQQHQHRVDRLRHFMELYRDLAIWEDRGTENRIFICMSGLDQLCDARGNARNPMFRAFFRLISGCGVKRPKEAPSKMPLDLLLISGTEDVPIRYLSHEVLKSDLEEGIGTRHAANGFHWLERDEIALEKWPLLPSIALEERYWLVPDASDAEPTLAKTMLSLLSNHRPGSMYPYPYLNGLMDNSVALSSWVFGIASIDQSNHEPERLERDATAILRRLEAAAARAGANGVLRAAMNLLDDWLPMAEPLTSNCKRYAALRQSIFIEPIKDVINIAVKTNREKLESTVGSLEEPGLPTKSWENRQITLAKLVLQHLSLFPIPVEARVLYGCPEIKHALIGDLRSQWEAAIVPDAGMSDDPEAAKARRALAYRMRWRSRELAMAELKDILKVLNDASLIIQIDPKRSNIAATARQATFDTHYRYVIHDQLRDFLAHQMRFFVPDRGERNFFQVSLYCDQPRDLPTPSEEHYRMFRGILNSQISAFQRSLWHLYQWSDDADGMSERIERMSNQEKLRFIRGFSRRLNGSNNHFDKECLSLHAIPQRIRAVYGLLRAGFSIGTISRLSGFTGTHERDQPYETFRGWLRGLTNGAIAMDEQWEKILKISGYKSADPNDPEDATGETVERNDEVIEVDLTAYKPSNVARLTDEIPGSEAWGGATASGPYIITGEHAGNQQEPARPLYRDEIGWLLNERGLISLVQGHLFDAIPLFERALLVMRHGSNGTQDDPALHAATRRVRLNLAIAHIDRGNLFRARRIIEELQLPEGLSPHSGSAVAWIGGGYLGLIDHLSGHFQSAKARYEEVIDGANRRQMLRLVSIFNRHLADLHRSMGNGPDALAAINLSINAAMQSEQRDILHAARLSRTKVRSTGQAGPADRDMLDIERCLSFAVELGAPRLETEALRVQARLMLERGERVMAGQTAARAAALAARCGLRLHKVSALSVYAEALRQRQQTGLCREILAEARAEAERLGFQIRAGEMSDMLAELAPG